ncbi:MAG: response regulator [Deltaproteobacteria bacterium]|jgi:two-component system chemotaxis response regulator CheY
MSHALVVDDSRAMRAILTKQLKQLGFEVLEAEHGEQALERITSAPTMPVLALVDWNMPRMNGIEFVRAVRNRRDLDQMRLMMVTTETELSQVRVALEAGADEYMMKPFTPDALLSKLQTMGLP